MGLNLSILYRGPLSSCDYDCWYCPFAKNQDKAAELSRDRKALDRFVDWISHRGQDQFSILFTPWGEGLIRRWYRDAIVRLSHQSNIRKVAIQTNLSCSLDWIDKCNRKTAAFWCSYHPSQVSRNRFLSQCNRLQESGIRFSVGTVGLREQFEEIDALRRELPPDVYLWINAYKDQPDYYTADEIERLQQIDPLFEFNNTRHPSLGKSCRTGEQVVSVDGDGTIRRCHFIKTPIGNIYEKNFESVLKPRSCTNETCGCHIGYVHLHDLPLYEIFGDGVLERVPTGWKKTKEELLCEIFADK